MTDFLPYPAAPETNALPADRRPDAPTRAVAPSPPGASPVSPVSPVSADALPHDLPGDDFDSTMAQLEGASEIVGFGGLGAKLNWLRAGVLGANDGVVSGAGITIGVAVADPSNIATIMLAGIAGLLAGASAMAMGEYVSVSSQRDTEEALIARERHDLHHKPQEEFEELVDVYRRQGLTDHTARAVVKELTAHNVLGAHLRAEYGVHPDELTTPWHAAFASAVSFTAGFLLPLSSMYLLPTDLRVPVTILVGLIGLFATGMASAIISGSSKARPILRNVVGGSIAMALTWAIGQLFGVHAG